MKRKVRVKRAKAVSLRILAAQHADRLSIIELKLKEFGEGIEENNNLLSQINGTPLSTMREVDRLVKKLDSFMVEKGEDVDRIFPDIRDRFNTMAEAVNKISAYAKALDEAGGGLRWLTKKRIKALTNSDNNNVEEILKLKHRLHRMEQKL